MLLEPSGDAGNQVIANGEVRRQVPAVEYSTEMRCHRYLYEKGVLARKGVGF